MKKLTNDQILADANIRGCITEKEILLLKSRKYNISGLSLNITKEQTEKGLNFIQNYIYTPNFKVRKNCNLTEAQIKIFNSFEYFEFCGFTPTCYPIYRVNNYKGENFTYYYSNGQINIL